jgi:hypothetical protein
LEQSELERVPRRLTACGHFTIHQINGVRALISGQANAAPEKIQESISMAREYWSEDVSLLLVRSEPLQVLRRTPTAVNEQDRRELATTLRTPEQCVQPDRTILHNDILRAAIGCALRRRRRRRER